MLQPEEHVHRIVCCRYCCCCCCTIFIAFLHLLQLLLKLNYEAMAEKMQELGSFSCYQLIYILMLLLLLQRKCMHKIRFIHCNCNNLCLHLHSTCCPLSLARSLWSFVLSDENSFCWPCHSSGDSINIWLAQSAPSKTFVHFLSSLLFISVVNLCLASILICTCFPHSCQYFGQFKYIWYIQIISVFRFVYWKSNRY